MKLESEFLLHTAVMLTHSVSDGVSAANSVTKYGGTPDAIEGAHKDLQEADNKISHVETLLGIIADLEGVSL
nr:MAG TPA: hypothetical protein [Caudoviricetes sp.]